MTYSIHIITYMHVFRADCVAWVKQLVCFFMEKTTTPTLSLPQLPKVPCIGLKPCGVFLIYSNKFLGVVLVQFTVGQLC